MNPPVTYEKKVDWAGYAHIYPLLEDKYTLETARPYLVRFLLEFGEEIAYNMSAFRKIIASANGHDNVGNIAIKRRLARSYVIEPGGNNPDFILMISKAIGKARDEYWSGKLKPSEPNKFPIDIDRALSLLVETPIQFSSIDY